MIFKAKGSSAVPSTLDYIKAQMVCFQLFKQCLSQQLLSTIIILPKQSMSETQISCFELKAKAFLHKVAKLLLSLSD